MATRSPCARSSGLNSELQRQHLRAVVWLLAMSTTAISAVSALPGCPTSFTVINALTDQPVPGFELLTSSVVINYAVSPFTPGPGTAINIRADVEPGATDSVAWYFDGVQVRTERAAPYAFGGDRRGDYYPSPIALGTHTVQMVSIRPNGNCTGSLSLTVIDQPKAFPCNGAIYMGLVSATDASMNLLDPTKTPAVFQQLWSTQNWSINAIGFRRSDGHIYGVGTIRGESTRHIVKMDALGTITDLGWPNGPSVTTNWWTGDVRGDELYFTRSATPQLWAVHLDTLNARLVTMSSNLGAGDMGYHSPDDLFYAVDSDGTNTRVLKSIHPTTGQSTTLGPVTGIPAKGFGGQQFQQPGILALFQNQEGTTYRIAISNRTLVGSQTGPSTGSADGAGCINGDLVLSTEVFFPDAPGPGTMTIVVKAESLQGVSIASLRGWADLTSLGTMGEDWVVTAVGSDQNTHNPQYNGYTDTQLFRAGASLQAPPIAGRRRLLQVSPLVEKIYIQVSVNGPIPCAAAGFTFPLSSTAALEDGTVIGTQGTLGAAGGEQNEPGNGLNVCSGPVGSGDPPPIPNVHHSDCATCTATGTFDQQNPSADLSAVASSLGTTAKLCWTGA